MIPSRSWGLGHITSHTAILQVPVPLLYTVTQGETVRAHLNLSGPSLVPALLQNLRYGTGINFVLLYGTAHVESSISSALAHLISSGLLIRSPPHTSPRLITSSRSSSIWNQLATKSRNQERCPPAPHTQLHVTTNTKALWRCPPKQRVDLRQCH